MSYNVTIEGFDALRRKLGQNFAPTIRAITLAIGQELRKRLAVYPRKTAGPVKWASQKQRAWYHAQRKAEGLPLEYTRNSDPWSQRLGPGWNARNEGTMDAVVETGATYAAYVQRDPKHTSGIVQQPMHAATGWITDLQAIDALQKSGQPERIAKDKIEHALRTG